jgi:hypothetical protein
MLFLLMLNLSMNMLPLLRAFGAMGMGNTHLHMVLGRGTVAINCMRKTAAMCLFGGLSTLGRLGCILYWVYLLVMDSILN